jgi:PhnB protein
MENKVMHASFRIGETILMASDGRCEGEPRFEGFSLSIVVSDEQKGRERLQRACGRRQGYNAS